MCGRFNLAYSSGDISDKLPGVLWEIEKLPSFNIAPSTIILVVHGSNQGFTGSLMKWGIPITDASGRQVLMSNTRIERLLENNSLSSRSDALCFIPATGFYEWEQNSKTKIPFNVRLTDSELFVMVGIYRKTANGNYCSILTCEAPQPLRDIHPRSPLMLEASLDIIQSNEKRSAIEYLKFSLDMQKKLQVNLTQVSPRINNVSFNSPECLNEDVTHQIQLL